MIDRCIGTRVHWRVVLDCVHEPVTTRALEAKRVKLTLAAHENGKAEPKVSDLDVWALVVSTWDLASKSWTLFANA